MSLDVSTMQSSNNQATKKRRDITEQVCMDHCWEVPGAIGEIKTGFSFIKSMKSSKAACGVAVGT